MKRVLSLIVLVMLSLFCAACARPQGYIDFTQPQDTHPAAEEPDTKPLRIAFASVMSPKETRQVYQQIVNYISQQENRPAILIQRRTYEELNALLANGDADVAFSSTGAYAAYQGHEPIELLAMTETNGSSYYQTYIITAADSDIIDTHQLQGRVFAFTDPLSYSGCLAITFRLAQQGTTPEQFFKRFFFTHGHDKSIWAVANHLADAAGVDSQISSSQNRRIPSWPDRCGCWKRCRKRRQGLSSCAVVWTRKKRRLCGGYSIQCTKTLIYRGP